LHLGQKFKKIIYNKICTQRHVSASIYRSQITEETFMIDLQGDFYITIDI